MDVLDLLDSDEEVFASKPAVDDTKDTFDYWGDPNVEPAEIDPAKLKKPPKHYSIAYFVPNGSIMPEAMSNKLVQIAKSLTTKGYKFRHYGSKNDVIQNKILEVEDINFESYLAWKSFNDEISSPLCKKASPCAYKRACYFYINREGVNRFKGLKNGLRAVVASQLQAMLGKECDTPIKFLVAYSESGAEGMVKGMDFEKTGNLTYYLRIAAKANIPVFNIAKEGSVERLVEFIKNSEPKEENIT